LQVAGTIHHQFTKQVDPFVKPGDPASGLLPGVVPMREGKDGDGDHRIQAYCFRLCTTDDPANRRAGPSPPVMTRATTNCYFVTSRRGTCVCLGIHCGCPIANPIPTITSRSAPITLA
jgi:hypothetical protein